jgi:protein MPE1
MQSGKESEQITFSGNGIKLIDLKREIVEKKNFSTAFDFELQIVDENNKTKEYVGDDEMVPKNSSLIVKRVPAKNAKFGLTARLNSRQNGAG